jgi:hypothetical protein
MKSLLALAVGQHGSPFGAGFLRVLQAFLDLLAGKNESPLTDVQHVAVAQFGLGDSIAIDVEREISPQIPKDYAVSQLANDALQWRHRRIIKRNVNG